jgi:lysophospholipase L1-like esterase
MQISNLRKKLLVALSEREFYNSIAVVGDSNAPFFAGHECIYITKDNLPDLNFKDKKCFSFDLGTPCFSYYIESTIYSFTETNIEEYFDKILDTVKDKKYIFFLFGTNDCVAGVKNNTDYTEYAKILDSYMEKINSFVEKNKNSTKIKKAIILSPTKVSSIMYTNEHLIKVSEAYGLDVHKRFLDLNIIANTVNFTGDYLFKNFNRYSNIYAFPCNKILSKSDKEIEEKYTFDGIHLNPMGVRTLKKHVYTVLLETGEFNDN